MQKLKCKKCGHSWVPRVEIPKRCPHLKCRSSEWDIPGLPKGQYREFIFCPRLEGFEYNAFFCFLIYMCDWKTGKLYISKQDKWMMKNFECFKILKKIGAIVYKETKFGYNVQFKEWDKYQTGDNILSWVKIAKKRGDI